MADRTPERDEADQALMFTVPLAAVSTPSEVSSSDDVAELLVASRPSKKRKPTYVARKEEKEGLEREIHGLESQVAVLQQRASGTSTDVLGLERATAENTVLSALVHHQQFALATAQSMLAGCVGEQRAFPLYTHIHLSEEWSDRQRTLAALGEQKLRTAYRFIQERTAHLDVLKPHTSDERFVDSEGGFSCVRLDVVQFDGVDSLKQVFDAALNYMFNMEINISERLGHVTVREDYPAIDRNIYNFRMVSNDDNGVSTESSAVSTAQYFDTDKPFGQPVAVCVSDCVDQDDLFPYDPTKHVRKDISGTVILTAHRRQRHPSNIATVHGDGGELVVVMRRMAFLRLHPAQFEISPLALQEMREGIARWGDVMLKSIRELVYPRH